MRPRGRAHGRLRTHQECARTWGGGGGGGSHRVGWGGGAAGWGGVGLGTPSSSSSSRTHTRHSARGAKCRGDGERGGEQRLAHPRHVVGWVESGVGQGVGWGAAGQGGVGWGGVGCGGAWHTLAITTARARATILRTKAAASAGRAAEKVSAERAWNSPAPIGMTLTSPKREAAPASPPSSSTTSSTAAASPTTSTTPAASSLCYRAGAGRTGRGGGSRGTGR